MRSVSLLFLAALCACSGDDDGSGPGPDTDESTGDTSDTEPTTTDTSSTTGEPWFVRNHEGSLVVRRVTSVGSSGGGGVDISAVFSDDLSGATTGMWCRDAGVCIDALPDQQPQRINSAFRQATTPYDWVGEGLFVGWDPRRWIQVPFVADPISGFGFYRRLGAKFDEDEPSPYRLGFTGAWDDVEIDDLVVLPVMPRVTLTNPAVAFNSTDVEFTWEYPPEEVMPKGEGRMFLRIASNQVDEIIPVRDDGEVSIDLSAYDLNPSSNVDLFLGRWIDETRQVDRGNVLHFYSVIESSVTTPRCNIDMSVNTPARPPAQTGVVVEAHAMSMGFRGVVDRGELHDFREDTTGLGFDNVSAEVRFQMHDLDGTVCELRYDASQALPAPNFAADSGALVQEAFSITPNPNSLYQVCYGPALEVGVTSGDLSTGAPIVVTVEPGVADNGNAVLNQLSRASRDVQPTSGTDKRRRDLVVIGLNGVQVLTGEEVDVSVQPVAPTPAATAVVLGSFEVNGADATELEDERTFTSRLPEGFADPDPRSVVEGESWTFGFGESFAERGQIDNGSERVWGFFALPPEAVAGIEIGAGLATHLSDCSTVDPDGSSLRYASSIPMKSGLFEMVGTLLLPLEPPVDTGSTGHTGLTGDTGSTTP